MLALLFSIHDRFREVTVLKALDTLPRLYSETNRP
jgi:hypothetical protein